jgi:hypothetical protein
MNETRSDLIQIFHAHLRVLELNIKDGEHAKAKEVMRLLGGIINEHKDEQPDVCRRAFEAAERVAKGGPVLRDDTPPPPRRIVEGARGSAYYTVKFEGGEHAGEHITFRVRRQKPDADFAPGELILGFLSGPDNYTGCAFVKDDGRVILWKRYRSNEHSRLRDGIRVLEGDPKACASAYSLESGKCAICGAPLTNPDSIEMGMGPDCAARFNY